MMAILMETRIRSLGWEDPLEKEVATHSRSLAWEIPGAEEHGGPQFVGSQEWDTTQRTKHHSDWCDMVPHCSFDLYFSNN